MTLHDKAVEAAADCSIGMGLDMGLKEAKAIHDAIMATYAAAGWKLTPRDATEGMMFDGHEAARKVQVSGISGMTIDAQMRNKSAREIAAWSAMHDAAPSPEDET